MIIEDCDAPKTVLVDGRPAADREIIVDSLTRAFWDDPMYNWLAKPDAYLGARFRRLRLIGNILLFRMNKFGQPKTV